MTLKNIFRIEVSGWESLLAATSYAKSIELDPGMFERQAYQRISTAVRKLKTLPRSWAMQIAGVVQHEVEDASS